MSHHEGGNGGLILAGEGGALSSLSLLQVCESAGCEYCCDLCWRDMLDPAVLLKARALHPALSLAAVSLSQSRFSDSGDSLPASEALGLGRRAAEHPCPGRAVQEAHAERTSAAWHKQTKCDCLITCSRPFAGLAGLMGKKMHCFQPRQKLGCHSCPGACALHYNASSGRTDGPKGCCQAWASHVLWSQAEAELPPLRLACPQVSGQALQSWVGGAQAGR